ncbi:FitA-like ribbon-helix-helix domain-containing protein [Jiella avicenniae]|uniref:Antitoxin FitA-like ribbon-helix-helix domain-containing protein n=1 Tax=Jiella avicenniae TaxID=2907202 RepID=A0A9X1P129_9HYPH|nr:hypothetical protein [Jiella avicenniae]MCE7028400.1 hypothetical protein [Jiella avicenniae]
MASLTIDDLDDDVMRRLEARAKEHGRSPADEVRALISSKIDAEPAGATALRDWDDDKERRLQRILSLGRKPHQPFDQKAYTDELWSFVE